MRPAVRSVRSGRSTDAVEVGGRDDGSRSRRPATPASARRNPPCHRCSIESVTARRGVHGGVIAAWLVVAIAVVAASSAFGRDLDDSFAVPGVDSQQAVDLLSAAGSDSAGLTARVVVTPLDPGATLDSSDARREVATIVDDLAALPNVLAVTEPFADGGVSSDGRVAVVTVQYPVIEALDAGDLERLLDAVDTARADSTLQVEAGGDLFFAFDEAETGASELIGLLVAMIVLLVAFGSLIAMGLPIGMALFGLALGVSSMSLIAHLIDMPSWAPQIGSMIGLGVGHRLRPVPRHPPSRVPASRARRRRSRGTSRRHRRPGGDLRRRHRRHRDPRPRRRRRSVHDRGRRGDLGDRADHGRRVGHAAPGVPRRGRAVDRPARHPPAPSHAAWSVPAGPAGVGTSRTMRGRTRSV